MRTYKTPNREKIKLRRVSDEEFNSLKERFPQWDNKVCPTCGGVGEFKWKNFKNVCECEDEEFSTLQKDLARHYLLANIGVAYHSLWFDDFSSEKQELKNIIENYIANWDYNKLYGRGVVFSGGLGTGKTFAQLLILKELIKMGEKCWFVSFSSAVSDYVDLERKKDLLNAIRSAACLSLDEIIPPTSAKQKDLYAEVFEHIIRYRVENNMPTLLGTNIDFDKLNSLYPRVCSLLEQNYLFIELEGEDNRKTTAKQEVERLTKGKERRPVR